ncbi:hypothetical protein CDAR_177771 [Caerostris darwini]|uniref:Uncharacterized protein n=1 Tax=Caerostris darwini TaxID=1538125 RepID=A0AAV4RMQ9_9ARAC|nr:hypothetical protein CDAR_177771 [Caerostris darwini]
MGPIAESWGDNGPSSSDIIGDALLCIRRPRRLNGACALIKKRDGDVRFRGAWESMGAWAVLEVRCVSCRSAVSILFEQHLKNNNKIINDS